MFDIKSCMICIYRAWPVDDVKSTIRHASYHVSIYDVVSFYSENGIRNSDGIFVDLASDAFDLLLLHLSLKLIQWEIKLIICLE